MSHQGLKLGNRFPGLAGVTGSASQRQAARPPLQMGEIGGWAYAQPRIRTRACEGTRRVAGNG